MKWPRVVKQTCVCVRESVSNGDIRFKTSESLWSKVFSLDAPLHSLIDDLFRLNNRFI